ncbi:MAG TPA: GNAT family N-acetyltransferase [Acidimicrobiales bacterium]|nr:GNAT family N-acetyltransferase [Acidimicrobiales bacterium]
MAAETRAPRLATTADVDELVRLRALMMGMLGELGEPPEPTWRDACTAFLHDALATGDAGALVVDDPIVPGRLVACGVGTVTRRLPGPRTPDGRYGYIASMVTEAAWQGRGLATAIVAGLLHWFRDQGIDKVDLHATAHGEPIYRALGFAEGAFPELRWRGPSTARSGTPGSSLDRAVKYGGRP